MKSADLPSVASVASGPDRAPRVSLRLALALSLATGLVAALAGCGQKGPLQLPDETRARPAPGAASTPATAPAPAPPR